MPSELSIYIRDIAWEFKSREQTDNLLGIEGELEEKDSHQTSFIRTEGEKWAGGCQDSTKGDHGRLIQRGYKNSRLKLKRSIGFQIFRVSWDLRESTGLVEVVKSFQELQEGTEL